MRRLLSMNLLTKWMLLLLATTIFPLFLTQLVTHTLATDIIQRQTRALSRANLQQSANSMRDFFTDYDSILLDIYTDDNYIANLQAVNVWDSNRYDAAKHWIEKNLENLLYVHPDILGIALIGRNGEATFYDTVTMSGQESFCFALGTCAATPVPGCPDHAQHGLFRNPYQDRHLEWTQKSVLYRASAHRLQQHAQRPHWLCDAVSGRRAMREVYLPGMESGNSLTFLLGGEGEILSFPQTAHVG
jgi:two-component system sensor histidine kinase YesM